VNYTLLTADRGTHLRVVCIALSATILLVCVCAFARLSPHADARETAHIATIPEFDGGRVHFSAAIERAPL
jgi:hypothetical protein